MIYFDPPYGIKYGSNFQPFVNKRDVKDGKDEDLTAEPEMIKAFRDTWELGIHSYLTYLRDRLLLARELLTESGSIFVQISDENVHHVRELMDEVFGKHNFVSAIILKKTAGMGQRYLDNVSDYILWYAKDIGMLKYRALFLPRRETTLAEQYNWLEETAGTRRKLMKDELSKSWDGRRFRLSPLFSQSGGDTSAFEYHWQGQTWRRATNQYWKTSPAGLDALAAANRLMGVGQLLWYVRYHDDFLVVSLNNVWDDLATAFQARIFVVQTNPLVLQRCLLMTTDPGDLVFDTTCGSKEN